MKGIWFVFTRVPRSVSDATSRLELKVFGENENKIWENALMLAESFGYEDFAELNVLTV